MKNTRAQNLKQYSKYQLWHYEGPDCKPICTAKRSSATTLNKSAVTCPRCLEIINKECV